jgi:hypothetical protein
MARPSNNFSTAATLGLERAGFFTVFGLAMATFMGQTNRGAGLRRAGSDARTKEERWEVFR